MFLMNFCLFVQFLVLQECATDSEELIYPIRAPSSCSAPPDLLLTGDRNKDAKVQSSTPRNGTISPDRMLLEVSSVVGQIASNTIRINIQYQNASVCFTKRNSRAMCQLRAVENRLSHYSFHLHSMIWTDIMEK